MRFFPSALVLSVCLVSVASAQVRELTQVNANAGFNPASNNANNGHSIANWGKYFLIAYTEQFGTSDATEDIYAVVSSDGGFTWSAPARVDVGDPANSTDSNAPQATVTEDPQNPGNPIFAVIAEDSRYEALSGGQTTGNGACDDVVAWWSTDGSTWSLATTTISPMMPGALNLRAGTCVFDPVTNANIAGGETDLSRIFSENGTVIAYWEEDAVNAGCVFGDEAFFCSVSTDGGRSYGAPVRLNDLADSTSCAGAMTNDIDDPFIHGDGSIVCAVWCDDIYVTQGIAGASGDDIFVSMSYDGGLTWLPPVSIEAGSGIPDAGDVDDVYCWVNGSTIIVYYQDDEFHSADAPVMIISNDGGFTWGQEIVVSPATVATAGAGVFYLDAVVTGQNIYMVYCSDFDAASLSGAPANGGNDDFRQAYLSVSNDGGVTWAFDIPLDPGRANNETQLGADGNKVVVSLQTKPFGNNDLAYVTSLDGGQTFRFDLVQNSQLADIDQFDNRGSRHFVLNGELQTGMSTVFYNILGQNERYAAGVRFPGLNKIAAGGSFQQFEVNGVFEPNPGSTFLVAFSASGTTPNSVVGNQMLNFVIDATTLALLNDPVILPFASGSVNGLGTGAGLPFPGFSGLGLTAVGAVFTSAGIQLTDPIGL